MEPGAVIRSIKMRRALRNAVCTLLSFLVVNGERELAMVGVENIMRAS
jgi:hypothetical protein